MDTYEESRERLDQPELEDEAADQRALVPLQVGQTDFHGDLLVVALVEINGERQAVVPLRQFCEYLGVDWSAQRQRLVRDEVLAAEMLSIAVTNEQLPRKRGYYNRPVICLPLEVLPGWLFNISPTRVKPALQEKVQRYRRLCFHVIQNTPASFRMIRKIRWEGKVSLSGKHSLGILSRCGVPFNAVNCSRLRSQPL
jgi:hypothetical protein